MNIYTISMPDDNFMKKSKIKECAFTIRMFFFYFVLLCFFVFIFNEIENKLQKENRV